MEEDRDHIIDEPVDDADEVAEPNDIDDIDDDAGADDDMEDFPE